MQTKLVSLFLSILVASIPTLAQDKRGPSTEEERTKAIASIADLEKNPFGAEAKEERRWLTLWLIEVPDIHVKVCTLLPNLPKGDKKDSNIIFTQMMFSSAGYAIQHMNDPSDDLAQYSAGVNGALRLYEILLAANPKDRQPALDDLVQKRDAGTLNAYVKEKAATTCKN